MKNNLSLLISALACAGLAWLFFSHFQNSAFAILMLIFLGAIIAKHVVGKFRGRGG